MTAVNTGVCGCYYRCQF